MRCFERIGCAETVFDKVIKRRIVSRTDSGSESNFISERLSQRLNVTRRRVDVSVLGIGQATTKVKQRITAEIRSRLSDYSRKMSFLVLPKVTANIPTTTINTSGWTLPKGIELADPSFGVSGSVDLVLGVESFFDFFDSGKKISLGERLPALQDSVFGWVVSGGFADIGQGLQINCNVATMDTLEELLCRFWTIENVESTNNYSPNETRCEAIFEDTVQRGTDGRYTVSLPKHEDILSRLGESKEIAFRRFQGTERRLSKNASLREQYVAFMVRHMRKVEVDETVKRCFLPHHPVVKEASTTTKVRVVFDASCSTSSGLSLNDALLVGPIIQQDLRSIILRCCTKQIMVVADVEKMFRQVLVSPIDRPLQSILWRSSPIEEVGVFELNTVTYGTRPAPFLATRTLNQLAMDEGERYPLAAKAIVEDTYMDDVITGCDSVEEAIELHRISEINRAVCSSEGIRLEEDSTVKTLGLTWHPSSDVFSFQFKVCPINPNEVLTKRQVLSIIATLFDPLGFIGATITAAKVFMQLLWKEIRLGSTVTLNGG
ncbi:uncharacterized protein LOC134206037 [Armigeres subalbatus]|uniref:uncharacterized protein LOC134206037 n=1 Tax=Armigeres subalbatus TaxID=124917 RepID=UPI002ED46F5C